MEGVVNRYIHLVHLEAKVSFGTFKEQAGGQDLRGPLCISIGIFSTIPYTCMWWYNWYNYLWYNYMWCYNCYNWYQWKTILLHHMQVQGIVEKILILIQSGPLRSWPPACSLNVPKPTLFQHKCPQSRIYT